MITVSYVKFSKCGHFSTLLISDLGYRSEYAQMISVIHQMLNHGTFYLFDNTLMRKDFIFNINTIV